MIRVQRGDIATAGTSAILRPVTSEWAAVTPSTRRLELALGLDLADLCAATGELPVGSALVTPAGNLDCELVVHVAVRSSSEPVTPAGVERALQAGLRRLEEWGVRSVAMPPLGTGAGNLGIEEAAELAVPALVAHMEVSAYPEEIVIVVESEYEEDVFSNRLRRSHAIRETGTVRGSR